MQGGKYLAEERGALEPEPEPEPQPATVPLYQAAAAHDGAPPDRWLELFYEWWGWLD